MAKALTCGHGTIWAEPDQALSAHEFTNIWLGIDQAANLVAARSRSDEVIGTQHDPGRPEQPLKTAPDRGLAGARTAIQDHDRRRHPSNGIRYLAPVTVAPHRRPGARPAFGRVPPAPVRRRSAVVAGRRCHHVRPGSALRGRGRTEARCRCRPPRRLRQLPVGDATARQARTAAGRIWRKNHVQGRFRLRRAPRDCAAHRSVR
jgi:hypothetical protein